MSFALFAALLACSRPQVRVPDDSAAHSDGPPDDSAPAWTGPACEPQARIEVPFWTEGETLSFDFDCASGEPRATYEASITALPAGASFDAESWRLDWTPGLAQGGRYDLLLAVHPRAAPEAFPESAVATFWVADAVFDAKNQPVDPLTYTEEWGQPVFHLNPVRPVGDVYGPAVLTIYGKPHQVEVKTRGAASSGYPKHSYAIRFSDEDLDASRWGMGNKDHLYAITTFDDNSYVRQKLGYDLWIAMAEHWGAARLTPRTFFGVFYLNGAYHGLYLLCDRPDDHFAQEMGLSRDGNLYKAVDHDANFFRTDAYGEPKATLHDGYEKQEGLPEAGQPGAWDDLEALVAFSADSDDATFAAESPAWMRVDEFMDWWIFVHWTSSDDSAGKNAYLYNDPAAPEFRYCPWDLNHSFGQGWYTYRIPATVYNDFRNYNGVFRHFLLYEPSSGTLFGRMRALMDEGPLAAGWMTVWMDATYAQMDRSAARDWQRWASSFHNYWGSNDPNDYEQEKAYLYAWIEERDTYMRSVHP